MTNKMTINYLKVTYRFREKNITIKSVICEYLLDTHYFPLSCREMALF